jgi:hypothetical protein
LGWQAAYVAAAAQLDIDRVVGSERDVPFYVFITLVNLANLLLVTSPLFLVLLRRGRGQGYAAILACGATAAWTTPVPDPKDLLIGFYLWCLGQLFVLSAARLRPRTLAAMICIAVTRVFIWPAP